MSHLHIVAIEESWIFSQCLVATFRTSIAEDDHTLLVVPEAYEHRLVVVGVGANLRICHAEHHYADVVDVEALAADVNVDEVDGSR